MATRKASSAAVASHHGHELSARVTRSMVCWLQGQRPCDHPLATHRPTVGMWVVPQQRC